MSPFNKITSINVRNAFAGDPPVIDHTKVDLCEFEDSSVFSTSLNTQLNKVMVITWDPNTQIPDELASMLTFVLFNCTTSVELAETSDQVQSWS